MIIPNSNLWQLYLIEDRNLFQDMIVNVQSFYILMFEFYPLMTTHNHATINIHVQLLTMSFTIALRFLNAPEKWITRDIFCQKAWYQNLVQPLPLTTQVWNKVQLTYWFSLAFLAVIDNIKMKHNVTMMNIIWSNFDCQKMHLSQTTISSFSNFI